MALVMKHNTSRLDQRDIQAYLEPLLQKAKWPQVSASAGFPGIARDRRKPSTRITSVRSPHSLPGRKNVHAVVS